MPDESYESLKGEPEFRDLGVSGTEGFDQQQAFALDLLRDADAFVLVVLVGSKRGAVVALPTQEGNPEELAAMLDLYTRVGVTILEDAS